MRRYSVLIYNVETKIDGSSALFSDHMVRNVSVDFVARSLTVAVQDGRRGWLYKFLDKLNRDKDWKMFLQLTNNGEGDYAVEIRKPRLTGHTFCALEGSAEHKLVFMFEERMPLE